MKLGICCFAYDEGRSGISEYINQALKFFSSCESDVYCFIPRYEFIHLPESLKKTNLKFVVINLPNIKILELLFTYFILPFYYLIRDVDCVFYPAGNRRLNFFPLGRVVTTFHDLSQYHIKGKYDIFRTFYIKHFIPFFLKRVGHIFAISNSTKVDIINFFGFKDSEVEVNYNGFEPSLVGRVLEKKKEILYVSRIEHPGKNHINLLKAFQKLPEAIQGSYKIVFAGKEWSGSEVIKDYIVQENLQGKVLMTGFLESQELADYYSRASLFVHPSLFEGFGLPLLEAMNNDLNLCISDIPVFKEVCGDSALYFDASCPDDMALKIEESLKLISVKNNFKDRLQLFDWKRHFSKVHSSCKDLVNQK